MTLKVRSDVASGKDCVESWFTADREQLVLVTGIRSPWEPGGTLCILGIPPEGTLSRCEISTQDCVINCLIFGPVLIYCGMKAKRLYCQLITLREYFPRIGYTRCYLMQGYWRLQGFVLMQLSGVCFTQLYRCVSVQSQACQMALIETEVASL